MTNTLRSDAAGFTLIELMVVMGILSTLIGLGTVGIVAGLRSAEKGRVQLVVTNLDGEIESVGREGDFPRTLLDPKASGMEKLGSNQSVTNCGIESVLVVLNPAGGASRFDVSEVPWEGAIQNFDEDRADGELSSLSVDNGLMELIDPWGTPFAYFHYDDYEDAASRDYGTILTAEMEELTAAPWKKPSGGYYNSDSFQIISAGRDMLFNTEDDITNFQRQN